MDDFIFGSLATDQLRLEDIRSKWQGITHNQIRLPRDPLPNQPIDIILTIGPAHHCDRAWVYWTVDGSDPQGTQGQAKQGYCSQMQILASEWNTLLWGYIRRFKVILPGQPEKTLLRYRLSGFSDGEEEVFADGGKYYACYIDNDPAPAWSQDAVIYHVFIDRFYPGDRHHWHKPAGLTGFYGGRIAGIKDKLDYLSDLGVNVLYLSPIFPSPSHHGYDITDFMGIEPRLGDLNDFINLVEAVHSRKMRLILDFVPNHCSDQHPAFQDALKNERSPFRDWFSFTQWPDEYATFFGVKSLPQINLRHPEARQHILDAACHWLELGVDGFRLDYAIGPTPDFWADFRKRTRTVSPYCWTFGEVVDPPDAQLAFEGGLDGCLDFVLLEGLRQALAFGHWDAMTLAAFLDRHEAFFPKTFSRPAFLDNHDMNRFLWAAGNDKHRLKLAALCQFTLAGAPLIYYGTEVGLSQERDVRQGALGLPHQSRLPMLWGADQDNELFEFYSRLIHIRNQMVSLRSGSRHTLFADSTVLAYVRELNRERVAAVLNLSGVERTISFDGEWNQIVLASQVHCSVTNHNNRAVIVLPPLAGAIITEKLRQ